MPVEIQRQVSINMGGKARWAVRPNLLIEVDGRDFVKMPPSDLSFVRLVVEPLDIDCTAKGGPLSNSPGIKELLQLRNSKQAEDLLAAQPGQSARALFGDADAEPAPAPKRARRSVAQMRQMREEPKAIAVEVPGVAGGPPLSIDMIRPVHSQDDLCVPLEEGILEHLIVFLREAGITADMLVSKRRYKDGGVDAPKGIWRDGGKGYVVKVPVDTEASEGEPSKKYKRVKTFDEAVAFLHSQQSDEMPPVPLQNGDEKSSDDSVSPE